MSSKTSNPMVSAEEQAPVFAALGDPTRLSLVLRLSGGEPHSISQLTQGRNLTRQAVTKHLRILESAGLVRAVRSGREHLFELRPAQLDEMSQYLDRISRQWDAALARLKSYVEEEPPATP